MSQEFEKLFAQTRPAFSQDRTFQRARMLATSALAGLGRRTVTGLLCTSAQQFEDWSAAYRLFAKERFEHDALFAPAKHAVIEHLATDEPLVTMMDDTIVRKRGRKVHGAAWRRDPLGPHFQTNFVWGQRFLQISAALPDTNCPGQARGIPIEFIHAPTAIKPRKTASAQDWEEYRRQQDITKISSVGARKLHDLSSSLNNDANGRSIICAVDGGFTNRTMFRNIPEKTILIGRIRKDAKLFCPPDTENAPRRGRPRWYGKALPTPEQIRQDESIPWEKVGAFAAGKQHTFEVKRLSSVRWLGSGNHTVQVIVIRPLAYRPRKGAKLLYRKPAYLICTDPALPVDRLLQAYLWRWEIEVNFRDEKTLLGVGEAQVRNSSSVENVPSLIVATYALLLLAGTAAADISKLFPRPKWQQSVPPGRTTTQQLISLFRSQLWGQALRLNLRHFASTNQTQENAFYSCNALTSAVCYAAK
ncbi:MAG: transposase [Desulfovibrio sp.]|jgi:hypothetical protein|nr:transposase [Desulfovibrio sp.]